MRAEAIGRFPGLVIAIHALSFWPVWRWYAARMTDGSDEPWGIVALAAALALTWPSDRAMRIKPDDALLVGAASLTLIYALLTPFAPPLVRAILAMAALACSAVSITDSRKKLPAVATLFALSLPVIASLQFYAGYPLRAVTAMGATALLNLVGLGVERAGTTMLWQGHTVLVDAPCSGVRMLWAGTALACVLASQRAVLSWRGLAVALLMMVPAALTANMLRAAALFLLEIRTEPTPQWLHSLVGIATFALAGVSLAATESLLRKASGSRTRPLAQTQSAAGQ